MKKHGWLVGAAFLAGILLANLIGRETLGVYGLPSDYQVADERRLFCYVLAFWVYLKGKRSGVEVLPGVLGAVLTVFGVLLEAYVNPGLMRYVLGKFL